VGFPVAEDSSAQVVFPPDSPASPVATADPKDRAAPVRVTVAQGLFHRLSMRSAC
jgi:hypothetical protein